MLSFKLRILVFSLTISLCKGQPDPLKISELRKDFYIFKTYKMYEGQLFSANGMYVVGQKSVALFDTPWDSTQFQPLLDSIEAKHHKPVIFCIATHSHEDRTGGLEFYNKRGIKTFTSKKTDQISQKLHHKRAAYLFDNDTLFYLPPYRFQTLYAGAGHTFDNIVIWFAKEKVLYGGCLIKSTEAIDLGYIGEADLISWPKTIKKIQKACPNPSFIIPGHQDWKSPLSLEHTLKLLEKKKE